MGRTGKSGDFGLEERISVLAIPDKYLQKIKRFQKISQEKYAIIFHNVVLLSGWMTE